MKQRYLKVSDLLVRFGGISCRTLYNWKRDRGFPEAVDPAKRLYLISDVENWEAKEFAEVSWIRN